MAEVDITVQWIDGKVESFGVRPMTPLERAAQAIVDEIDRQDVCTMPNLWDDERNCEETGVLRLDGKVDLAALARAVIEAIREPSEGMKHIGGRIVANLSSGRAIVPYEDDAVNSYQAMIDALLSEGGK